MKISIRTKFSDAYFSTTYYDKDFTMQINNFTLKPIGFLKQKSGINKKELFEKYKEKDPLVTTPFNQDLINKILKNKHMTKNQLYEIIEPNSYKGLIVTIQDGLMFKYYVEHHVEIEKISNA